MTLSSKKSIAMHSTLYGAAGTSHFSDQMTFSGFDSQGTHKQNDRMYLKSTSNVILNDTDNLDPKCSLNIFKFKNTFEKQRMKNGFLMVHPYL